eukprot:13310_1
MNVKTVFFFLIWNSYVVGSAQIKGCYKMPFSCFFSMQDITHLSQSDVTNLMEKWNQGDSQDVFVWRLTNTQSFNVPRKIKQSEIDYVLGEEYDTITGYDLSDILLNHNYGIDANRMVLQGLYNLGVTCATNAALIHIACMPRLREGIQMYFNVVGTKFSNHLSSIFHAMETTVTKSDTERLIICLSKLKPHLNLGKEHGDGMELLCIILECVTDDFMQLVSSCNDFNLRFDVNSMLKIVVNQATFVRGIDGSISIIRKLTDDIYSTIKMDVSSTTLSQQLNNRFYVSDNGHRINHGEIAVSLPTYLNVEIERNEWLKDKNKTVKRCQRIPIERQINLNHYVVVENSDEKCDTCALNNVYTHKHGMSDAVYDLKAIMMHSGEADRGHDTNIVVGYYGYDRHLFIDNEEDDEVGNHYLEQMYGVDVIPTGVDANEIATACGLLYVKRDEETKAIELDI